MRESRHGTFGLDTDRLWPDLDLFFRIRSFFYRIQIRHLNNFTENNTFRQKCRVFLCKNFNNNFVIIYAGKLWSWDGSPPFLLGSDRIRNSMDKSTNIDERKWLLLFVHPWLSEHWAVWKFTLHCTKVTWPCEKTEPTTEFPVQLYSVQCTLYSVQSVTRGQKEKTGPMIIVFKTKCTHSTGTYLRHIEISDLPITRRNRNVSAISVADTNQNAIRIRNQDSDKSDPDPNLY